MSRLVLCISKQMRETEFMQRGVGGIMMVAAEAIHSVLTESQKKRERDR